MLERKYPSVMAKNSKHVVVVEQPEAPLFVLLQHPTTQPPFNVMYQKENASLC